MEFNLPNYIFQLFSMCDDETISEPYEVLEDIFESKYYECIEIYWLLKKYAPYMTSLSYSHKQNKKLKSLSITVKLKGVKNKDVIKELNETSPKGYILKVTNNRTSITISIRKKNK